MLTLNSPFFHADLSHQIGVLITIILPSDYDLSVFFGVVDIHRAMSICFSSGQLLVA